MIFLIVRLGYVSESSVIQGSTSGRYFLRDLMQDNDFEKLGQVIQANLVHLKETLLYNVKNSIHFYRISSGIIPLSTVQGLSFAYIFPYWSLYLEIRDILKKSGMRVDFHPNQYCILNSTKQEVIENAIRILWYHYKLLMAFGVENKVILLHVGSGQLGHENALARFLTTFYALPQALQKVIAIENDDKVFNVQDCLFLSRKCGVLVVIDYHHHCCNPSEGDFSLMVEEIFSLWKKRGMRPKVHFSSPKNRREYRAHADYIDGERFFSFLDFLRNFSYDVDIMLEAKAQDEALFRLMREIKYKRDYVFLDETSFLIDG